MNPSLRSRLLAIAVLSAALLAGALGALFYLARTTTEQRTDSGRAVVTAELERLAGVIAPIPVELRVTYGRRGLGDLHSGFALDADHVGKVNPAVAAAVKQAGETGQATVLLGERPDGTPIVVAAAPAKDQGFVWAALLIHASPELKTFRATVLLLAVASLVLVLGLAHTGAVFARGVTSLRRSLVALKDDLGAKVARPRLRELSEVADGVALLASGLSQAEIQREQLTRELAERERLATLGRVVAGVAHEVRNPLAAIKLRADLALTTLDPATPLGKDLEEIALEIGRLDRLVADLLVVAGGKVGPRAEVDLGALARKRGELIAPWAKDREVSIHIAGGATARVDADAIARVVDNLVRNAVEASPRGGSVDVTVAEQATDVRISVFDHGTGIPDGRASELFEPFFTTKPEGTGLGLALSRAIAASHGGTLGYAREVTLTRFTLTLPRVP